jgi:hypothetical protein
MSIKVLERMNKSYKVLLYDMKYKNNRPPHIETPTENLTGQRFMLGNRRVGIVGKNVAVMYDVIGVMNGQYKAHITVYFGSPDEADLY